MCQTVCREVLVRPSSSDEPLAPVDGVLVVDGLVRVEQVVQERQEVLGRLGRLRLGRIALRLVEKTKCSLWRNFGE